MDIIPPYGSSHPFNFLTIFFVMLLIAIMLWLTSKAYGIISDLTVKYGLPELSKIKEDAFYGLSAFDLGGSLIVLLSYLSLPLIAMSVPADRSTAVVFLIFTFIYFTFLYMAKDYLHELTLSFFNSGGEISFNLTKAVYETLKDTPPFLFLTTVVIVMARSIGRESGGIL